MSAPPLDPGGGPRKPPSPRPTAPPASRVVTTLLLATSLAAAAAAPAPGGQARKEATGSWGSAHMPPPANAFVDWTPQWSSYDAAALDVPAPPPPRAASTQRYLLLSFPLGPSHAFVLGRVGGELAKRGGSVLAVAPPLAAPHLKPPPGVDGGRWRTLHTQGGEGVIPALMATLQRERWREKYMILIFGPLYKALGKECDALLGNRTAMAEIKAYAPTFIVGDVMDPCAGVVSEVLGVPRVEIGVGSFIHHMFAASWPGSGRDWPLVPDPAGAPAAGVASVPPLSLLAAAANAAWHAAEAVIDALVLRPPIRALHARHGVDLSTAAAKARNALLVVNADPAWEHPRRLPPGVLLPGSITAGPGAPLPADLDAWLAAAAARGDRVVYAALGSIFKLPPGAAAPLLAGLAALPRVSVLAKFGGDELAAADGAALPPNVKVVAWAPQNDLLASSLVSLFLTHGGANSIGEAVHHGVPVVVAPQGAEQVDNAVKVAAAGFGVALHTRKPAADAVVAAAARALDALPTLAARARAAQARARVGRPPAAAAAAAAIERAALLGVGARVPLPQEVGGWWAAPAAGVALVAAAAAGVGAVVGARARGGKVKAD